MFAFNDEDFTWQSVVTYWDYCVLVALLTTLVAFKVYPLTLAAAAVLSYLWLSDLFQGALWGNP